MQLFGRNTINTFPPTGQVRRHTSSVIVHHLQSAAAPHILLISNTITIPFNILPEVIISLCEALLRWRHYPGCEEDGGYVQERNELQRQKTGGSFLSSNPEQVQA